MLKKQIIESETNAFYNRYYDKETRKFKTIEDIDKYHILGNSYYGINGKILTKQYIESDLQLNPKQFKRKNKKGEIIIDKTKIPNYEALNNKCLTKYGITIEDLYKTPISNTTVDKVAELYSQGLLNSEKLKDKSDDDLALYLLNTQINNSYKDTIENLSGAAINLYAYKHIDTDFNLIENPNYTAIATARAKAKYTGIIDNGVMSTIDESGVAQYGNFIQSNLGQMNKLSDEMNSIKIANEQIYKRLLEVNNPRMEELGFKSKGVVDREALLKANIADMDIIAEEKGYINDPNYKALKEDIITLKENQLNYDNLLSTQNSYKYNARRLYDLYDENPKQYHGIGWYGIASDVAKFIANNGISTVEEFRDAIKYSNISHSQSGGGGMFGSSTTYVLKDPKGNSYVNSSGFGYLSAMSDKEIQKEIANVLDNIKHRYEKKSGNKFEYVTNTYTISTNNTNLEKDLAVRKGVWASSKGALQVTTLGDGSSGNKIVPSQIAPLINLNQMPVTITTNDKGVTVRTQNLANSNSTPIDGKLYKINGKIYQTEVKYALNPLDQKKGYISYDIICKGKSGEYLGTIQCREQSPDVDNYILNIYEELAPLAVSRDNNKAKSDIGILVSNVNETKYEFKSNTATPAHSLTELKNNINAMYAEGENNFIYTLEAKDLIGGNLIKPIQVKITKTDKGYYVEDMSVSDPAAKGVISLPKEIYELTGLNGCNTGWNGKFEFPTLESAFSAISLFNLQWSSIQRKYNFTTK